MDWEIIQVILCSLLIIASDAIILLNPKFSDNKLFLNIRKVTACFWLLCIILFIIGNITELFQLEDNSTYNFLTDFGSIAIFAFMGVFLSLSIVAPLFFLIGWIIKRQKRK
jgi:hypothetical protein